jgi:antitoxin (DNA-binding transcriptional repressor) of toxin-antitoxin stability system
MDTYTTTATIFRVSFTEQLAAVNEGKTVIIQKHRKPLIAMVSFDMCSDEVKEGSKSITATLVRTDLTNIIADVMEGSSYKITKHKNVLAMLVSLKTLTALQQDADTSEEEAYNQTNDAMDALTDRLQEDDPDEAETTEEDEEPAVTVLLEDLADDTFDVPDEEKPVMQAAMQDISEDTDEAPSSLSIVPTDEELEAIADDDDGHDYLDPQYDELYDSYFADIGDTATDRPAVAR